MNVLLVDDDFYVIAALQKKIDWESLHIDTVYTANNVAQAREIIEKHSVQILISDIEMPQGSGLELLAWIREEIIVFRLFFLPIMQISTMRRKQSNCRALNISSNPLNLTS